MLRRTFDIAFSAASLLLLAVPMMVIAGAVAYRHGSPVIFSQPRYGQHKKPFQIYKFRSMSDDRDEAGQLLPDEKRVTPLGWFLRRTSMDELPQLFNILKGDMTFVGPRPWRPDNTIGSEYDERYTVPQGLTGLAQISPLRRNDLESAPLDVEYARTRTVLLDIKILLRTFNAVAIGHDTGPQPLSFIEKTTKPKDRSFDRNN